MHNAVEVAVQLDKHNVESGLAAAWHGAAWQRVKQLPSWDHYSRKLNPVEVPKPTDDQRADAARMAERMRKRRRHRPGKKSTKGG